MRTVSDRRLTLPLRVNGKSVAEGSPEAEPWGRDSGTRLKTGSCYRPAGDAALKSVWRFRARDLAGRHGRFKT
jgi:hypothetical protein